MSDHSKVAIFWDYENCNPPSSSCGLGYDIANNIGRIARIFGSVTTFRAYLDISAQSSKSAVVLRSELQSSGVSIIDCPHNGKKDVVDKMVLVDMLAFAVDHPAPATIILITGDRDYAYAVSTLKLRKYHVILVVPSSPHVLPCLENQASLVIDWGAAALRTRTEAMNSTQPIRQPYLDLDANLTTKLLREVQEISPDDSDTTLHLYSTLSQSASRPRRMSVRDLLEPSRHSKNAGSFDSTQDSTLNPPSPSPRKSTIAGSDSAHGGVSIPKTPERSRHTSVSTGSTRARSATIVAPSPPPAVDAKNSPPSTARLSSTSDITDVVCPTKRSPSALPSLDVLELPLQNSRPPSSIVVRSPLEPAQLTGDVLISGKPTIPSSHKLNCLASPFVMAQAPTELESVPNLCSKQSHAMAEPTSPIVASAKILTETVTAVCAKLTKGIEAPEDVEHHLTGTPIEHPDGKSERSIPHRAYPQEGARNAAHTPKSYFRDYSYAAPHATYSPSSRNVGSHLTDTPSDKHVSPPATVFLDGVDSSQFAASPRASNTPDRCGTGSLVPPPAAFPSTPFATTKSHEVDESERRSAWSMFEPLIYILLAAREAGIARPSRSTIAVGLVQSDTQVYRRAGVSKFRDYTALAEQAGIIELGGREGDAWIALHSKWFKVDGITTATTRFPSNRVASPTSDPPKAIQSPLLTGSKNPLIERNAIFQTLASGSPNCGSIESSNALPTSTGRQDSASTPAPFQPLIDVLTHMRADGFHKALRSLVGQFLSQDIYTRAGVPGFKEYIQQASDAQVVQVGGVGGHAWISLHPELRV